MAVRLAQGNEQLCVWLLHSLAALPFRKNPPVGSLPGPPVRQVGLEAEDEAQGQPSKIGRSRGEQKAGDSLWGQAPSKPPIHLSSTALGGSEPYGGLSTRH